MWQSNRTHGHALMQFPVPGTLGSIQPMTVHGAFLRPCCALPGQVLWEHGKWQGLAGAVLACRSAALVRLRNSVSSCRACRYASALSFAACPLIWACTAPNAFQAQLPCFQCPPPPCNSLRRPVPLCSMQHQVRETPQESSTTWMLPRMTPSSALSGLQCLSQGSQCAGRAEVIAQTSMSGDLPGTAAGPDPGLSSAQTAHGCVPLRSARSRRAGGSAASSPAAGASCSASWQAGLGSAALLRRHHACPAQHRMLCLSMHARTALLVN